MSNDATDSKWHRLHILSPLVRAGKGLVPILFIVISAQTPARSNGEDPVVNSLIHFAVAVVIAAIGLVSWLVTKWRVEDGTLRIETGLIRRSSLRFPLDQIQAIDTVRPGLARVFGLAELRLRMAGDTGSEGRLAYLKLDHAEKTRSQLLALAHGKHEDTPAPPENVLHTLPTSRLVGSIVFSNVGVIVLLVIMGLAIGSAISWSVTVTVIAASFPVVFVLALTTWRVFNSNYHLTVAEAPDGLRLRSGLVETSAETIPRGRIQAVRMRQPLLWRPFGWCRLEVDVAGRQKRKGENKAESRTLRSVLPVGDRVQALWMLERLLPATPTELIKPPTRSRFKNPLSFHFLSWGRNDKIAVCTYGRVEKRTDWVPLGKAQSIRLVQGPLQRRFGLSNIHIDTAGSNIHAVIRDRDAKEQLSTLEELIEKSRNERRA